MSVRAPARLDWISLARVIRRIALYQALALSGVSGCDPSETRTSDLASAAPTDATSAPEPPPLVELPPIEEVLVPYTFPFLPGEPSDRAVSIGDTTHGMLVNGATVTESASLKILPKQRARDLRYGTNAMVALLEHAGRALHQSTGTPLWLGNLGRKQGGDIEWSVSHNAGRDADVAFAYMDAATKKPVDPPDLVPLDGLGLSSDRKLAFDVARTWKIVKAMLEFEGASVQYLFISDALKKKLLEHAKSVGEPSKLIEHAADVLRQPGGAAPHDDHLHLRIYCTQLDAACGCEDAAFIHPRAKRFEDEGRKAREAALALLRSASVDERARALKRLGFIGTAADVALTHRYLDDPSPIVRRATAMLLGSAGDAKAAELIATRFAREEDPNVLATLIEAAGRLGGPASGALLRDIMESCHASAEPLPLGERPFLKLPPLEQGPSCLLVPEIDALDRLGRRGLADLAVRAARSVQSEHVLKPLLVELDAPEPEVVARAAEALAYLTNSQLLDDPRNPAALTRARNAYKAFVGTLGKPGKPLMWAPRDAWVLSGFQNRGYKVPGVDKRGVWELFRALADEPHVSWNARWFLIRILSANRAIAHYGPGDSCRTLWEIAWEHRRDLGLGNPTEEQRRACTKTRNREKEGLAAAELD